MAPLLVEMDGIAISIYGREHLPPHIHAYVADEEALVDIRTGTILKGDLPGKKLRIIQEWLAQGNNREIVEENFYELNPRLRLPEKAANEITSKEDKKKNKRKGGK